MNNHQDPRRLLRFVTLAALAAALAGGCSGRSAPTGGAVRRDRAVSGIMGTETQVAAYASTPSQAEAAVEAGIEELRTIDEALSAYRPESELSQVNRAAGGPPVTVGVLTGEAVLAARRVHWLTGGAYNPLAGSLVDLWRQAEATGRPPSDAEIAETLTLLDMDRLEIAGLDGGRGYRVRLALPGMQLDLGGMAKGWAADRAVARMRALDGVRAAMVSIGGDGAAWTAERFERPWTFGVQDPERTERPTVLERVRVRRGAVVTSGSYYRGFDVGGRRYSHVLDPRTGRPVRTRVASATVLCPDGGEADGLATAIMVLGAGDGLRLLESLPACEGLIFEKTLDGLARQPTTGYVNDEDGLDVREEATPGGRRKLP